MSFKRLTIPALLLSSAFTPLTSAHAQDIFTLSPMIVSAPKFEKVVEGTMTEVITKEDIKQSPAQNIPDLLKEIGVNVQDYYGDVAAVKATVDLRGFGATAGQSTLILLNGRKLNPIDMSGVNFTSIPVDWIERIEVIRGPAAGVLYGDGAIGGAVNIITKAPPKETEGSGKLTYGSYNTLMAEAQAGTSFGQIKGSYVKTDGYRDNSEVEQGTLGAKLYHNFGNKGRIYLNGDVYKQEMGYPGSLTRTQYEADRKQASTPENDASELGINIGLGGVYHISDEMRLYLPLNFNRKETKANYFSMTSFTDTDINTYTFNPKLQGTWSVLEYTAGLLANYTDYETKRATSKNGPATSRIEGSETQIDTYAQATVTPVKNLKTTAGVRGIFKQTDLKDRLGTTALDDNDTTFAANLGVDYKIIPSLSVFGNIAHNVRFPTVDERTYTAAMDYKLKTEKALNYEAGLTFTQGTALSATVSGYLMQLKDELRYNPVTMFNDNLDPSQRMGVDVDITFKPIKYFGIRGNYSFIDSEYRKGDLKGKEVPLVPKHAAGLSLLGNYEMVDGMISVVYTGKSFADGDDLNQYDKIPDYTTVDAKIGITYGPGRLELIAKNIFNEKYYTFAGNYGGFEAIYPMPGRMFLVSLSGKF